MEGEFSQEFTALAVLIDGGVLGVVVVEWEFLKIYLVFLRTSPTFVARDVRSINTQ